jgi:hypothetical protein
VGLLERQLQRRDLAGGHVHRLGNPVLVHERLSAVAASITGRAAPRALAPRRVPRTHSTAFDEGISRVVAATQKSVPGGTIALAPSGY